MMASAILSIICMSAFAKDDQGHTLTSMWKSFYTAMNQDKPQDQQKILENIKKEALSKKLAWDYYDACQQYVHVRSRANWKLTAPGIVECPQCHQMKLAHRVCKDCGYYNGVQVVNKDEKKDA